MKYTGEISEDLREVLDTIYRHDPRWYYQLHAAIGLGAPEAEIWKLIEEERRSRNPMRANAYKAVSSMVIAHLGNR